MTDRFQPLDEFAAERGAECVTTTRLRKDQQGTAVALWRDGKTGRLFGVVTHHRRGGSDGWDVLIPADIDTKIAATLHNAQTYLDGGKVAVFPAEAPTVEPSPNQREDVPDKVRRLLNLAEEVADDAEDGYTGRKEALETVRAMQSVVEDLKATLGW